MSEERNQRSIYEGPERRKNDRRQGERRNRDGRGYGTQSVVQKLFKVLVIMIVTVAIMKLFKF